MTTITVEIDKDNDISALKEFIGRLGLKYYENDTASLEYTDEIKTMLDRRHGDYQDGKVALVSAEESREKINELLASENS
jgi:hypothetical protein